MPFSQLPLLRTKTTIPPPRADAMPRAELLAQLERGLAGGCRLALLSAPAGYGKTTLAAGWLAVLAQRDPPQGARSAWLELDEEENDPVRFWSYFITAIQGIAPQAGKESLSLLQSAQAAPISLVLGLLLNDLADLPGSAILVLDDFHVIRTPAILEGIVYWLEHVPSGFTLMLLTRSDPFLPMARLRARRQVVELRLAELRFSQAEVRHFLRVSMELTLTDEQADALGATTEGWAAGLQLAALSLRGRNDLSAAVRSFNSSDRHLLDFFSEEILPCLPEPLQQFLVLTAGLDRFCASLCDAVTAQEAGHSAGLIASLERQNLFVVPLDSTRTWYRYHHLFGDLLGLRQQNTLSQVEITGLHRRAAAWFEQNGLDENALVHSLAAGDYERAGQRLEKLAFARLLAGEAQTVRRWLAAFPQEWGAANPAFLVIRAWERIASARFREAEPDLRAAEALLAQAGGPALRPEPGRSLAGHIAGARATVALNLREMEGVQGQAKLALELIPESEGLLRCVILMDLADWYWMMNQNEQAMLYYARSQQESLASGNILVAVNAIAMQGNFAAWSGNLAEAEAIFNQAIDTARQAGLPALPVVGLAEDGLARVCLEHFELERARELNQTALQRFRQWGHAYHIGTSLYTRGEICLARGDLAGAEETLEEMRHLARAEQLEFLRIQLVGLEAALRCHAGNPAAARSALETAGLWKPGTENLSLRASPFAARRMRFFSLAVQVRLALGDASGALELAGEALALASSTGQRVATAECQLLRALALGAGRKPAEARAALELALRPAASENWRRIFLEKGPAAAGLLREWLAAGRESDPAAAFAGELLAVLQPDAPPPFTPPAARPTVGAHAPDALSEREVQVLRLAAAGLSNEEIAGELYLSANTVKTHLKRIYEKLGVNSRLEAVTQARQLNLL